MKLLALVTAIVLLAACAAPPSSTPIAPGGQITYKKDPYTKVTTIQGGDIKNGQSSVHLRAARSTGRPDVEPTIALYASLFYSGTWRYYDSANTIDGKSWETRSVRRDVFSCLSSRCSYGELVLVTLTADYLREQMDRGVNIKIWGRGGAETFFIPPNYIAAFLAGTFNDARAL